MSESEDPKGASTGETSLASLSHSLVERITAVVGDVVCGNRDRIDQDLAAMQKAAEEVYRRKAAMVGTKNETRDLMAEVVFQRVCRGVRAFMDEAQPAHEVRVAERILGGLLTNSALADLAIAFDRAILENGGPKDFSFAGRSDFISIEEVVQLLGGGKHQGCLSLEKDDNRLDLYMSQGCVSFFDPHRMVRRVLPGSGQNYREIPLEAVEEAEKMHAQEGVPIFLTLQQKRFFGDLELRSVVRQLGNEILYEFLRDQGQAHFFYRQMRELPDFAVEHELRLGVTPILLENTKRLDDWRSMVRVFPDPDACLDPIPNMYARIASLNLGVLEIKMLAQINGENSPRDIARAVGLPLHDIYQYLVRFAREGVLTPPGGLEALADLSMSVEESMQMAFEALDANDDDAQIGSALDRVLGAGAFGGEADGVRPGASQPGSAAEKFNLDFLRAAKDDE